MKKIVLKWLVILVAIISAVWIFLDVVSVKETKSFSSSDGDIFNSPAADKLSSFLTILSNQDNNKKEVFYEKIDEIETIDNKTGESTGASEDSTLKDK